MSRLFSSFRLRSVEFRNRIFVSPMCQYSSLDGMPTDWHMVHLGSRAVGGAALVMVEATAISPEGRISPDDSGIWADRHGEAFSPITSFIRAQGSVAGIQLAHAGRKASTLVPWKGEGPISPEEGGWQPVAPSAVPFAPGFTVPRELSLADIDGVVEDFTAAAKRAFNAGFQVAEIHMAHGYLLHEFLSPLANRREDRYGGSLENRMRLPLQIATAVRGVWPEDLPLFVRISAVDWLAGGWDLPQSLELSRCLKEIGVDLIDCSAGFIVPDEPVPAGPGYQVPFAAAIRKETGIATGAVGFITDPAQAEQIIATGQADTVLLAREMLRDPYWPFHAAKALGVDITWPVQYEKAKK